MGAWSNHGQYEEEVAKANQQYGKVYAKFSNMPIEKVAKDPEAHAIAQTFSIPTVSNVTAPDAKGSKGFPDLTDNDWLWGGEPEKDSGNYRKGRTASMPAWGPALGEEGVKNVTHYVMSLSKPKGQYDEERAERGKSPV